MLSDLLRSGLLKDSHDRCMSTGMLSDLMRSGLPNDKSLWNTTNTVQKYAERPIEKRAT